MALNKSTGNMYEFVTHTWNTAKGECFHQCSYCYMKRFGNQKPIRFDEKELNTDLGKGNFIFVGSGNDMFSKEIPDRWIIDTICHCEKFNNCYLWQTKNPERLLDFLGYPVFEKSFACITLESDIWYPEIMRKSPKPYERADYFSYCFIPKLITIEPILKFNIKYFIDYIKNCGEINYVNIGADSGGNNLPEPSKEEILELIKELEKFTHVKLKKNLNRLIKNYNYE